MRPMAPTRTAALGCALAACAALATPAMARNTQELGAPKGSAFPKPDCPTNAILPNDPQGCQAIAQVTGFNFRVNGIRNPMRVKRPGYVTAFTVALAKPTAEQISFFKAQYGANPTARLAVVRSLHSGNQYRLLKQTQEFDLEPYFGSTPTIALRQAFRVHKDDIIALTVPNWLPAFAHNLPGDKERWRSSRQGEECTAESPPADPHEQLNTDKIYDCEYNGARLVYSATFVGDPKPTNVASKR
jgi:hypothetical protein